MVLTKLKHLSFTSGASLKFVPQREYSRVVIERGPGKHFLAYKCRKIDGGHMYSFMKRVDVRSDYRKLVKQSVLVFDNFIKQIFYDVTYNEKNEKQVYKMIAVFQKVRRSKRLSTKYHLVKL